MLIDDWSGPANTEGRVDISVEVLLAVDNSAACVLCTPICSHTYTHTRGESVWLQQFVQFQLSTGIQSWFVYAKFPYINMGMSGLEHWPITVSKGRLV